MRLMIEIGAEIWNEMRIGIGIEIGTENGTWTRIWIGIRMGNEMRIGMG